VKSTQIAAYCRVVAREFHPQKIILFGSYAYGRPTKESDVDILVVMPHGSGPVRQSVAIRQRCSAPFPVDLLVWTPAYAAKRLSWNDSFTREVFARGKLMYEAR
jgi:predicted nucleotidyltransferase